VNEIVKGGDPSPWPNLIAFIAALLFSGIGMALQWNPLDIVAVSSLYTIWRSGPGNE
jgi:hypothetical protein